MPLPPSRSRAFAAMDRAARVAEYLAMDAIGPVSRPSSSSRVARSTSSCTWVSWESISARRVCTLWAAASGRPNWTRCPAYCTAAS